MRARKNTHALVRRVERAARFARSTWCSTSDQHKSKRKNNPGVECSACVCVCANTHNIRTHTQIYVYMPMDRNSAAAECRVSTGSWFSIYVYVYKYGPENACAEAISRSPQRVSAICAFYFRYVLIVYRSDYNPGCAYVSTIIKACRQNMLCWCDVRSLTAAAADRSITPGV